MQQRVERKREQRRMWSNHKRYLKRRGVIQEDWRKRQQEILDAIVAKRYAMRPVQPPAPVKPKRGFFRRTFARVTAMITGRR